MAYMKTNKNIYCGISDWACPYHACLSNHCQKVHVNKNGADWGKGNCDKMKQPPEPEKELSNEAEANVFAYMLLMPDFDSAVKECGGDIASISKRYEVPQLAVRRYASHLGYRAGENKERDKYKAEEKIFNKISHIRG